MTGVMKALEQSEHAYMSHQSHAPMHHQGRVESSAMISYKVCFTLLCAPVLLVSIWLGYQQYQDTKLAWQANNQGEIQIVEVPIVYQQLDYPSFSHLEETRLATPVLNDVDSGLLSASNSELPLETNDSTLIEKTAPKKALEAQQPQEGDDMFKGLDLSSLSPELALRVEAAIGGEGDSELEPELESKLATSVDLSQQAERWYGKLPALNFQTHVYSSDRAKRWVKVNGVEYQEGHTIADGIELVAIEPQACLIRFRGEFIQIPALYDWQG